MKQNHKLYLKIIRKILNADYISPKKKYISLYNVDRIVRHDLSRV